MVAKPPKPSLDVKLNTRIRMIISGPQHVTCTEGNVEVISSEQAKEEALRLAKNK